jgi:Tfp pilus assembly protein PilZ
MRHGTIHWRCNFSPGTCYRNPSMRARIKQSRSSELSDSANPNTPAGNNVINFNSVRFRARPASDKRMHPRLESHDRLFTQIVLSTETPETVGNTLSCHAVNLSVGGIQFRSATPVAPGTLLDLWVDVSNRPGKFFLSGEVRWSRPTGEIDDQGREQWFIGVQLKSGAATDILDWRDYHASA